MPRTNYTTIFPQDTFGKRSAVVRAVRRGLRTR